MSQRLSDKGNQIETKISSHLQNSGKQKVSRENVPFLEINKDYREMHWPKGCQTVKEKTINTLSHSIAH